MISAMSGGFKPRIRSNNRLIANSEWAKDNNSHQIATTDELEKQQQQPRVGEKTQVEKSTCFVCAMLQRIRLIFLDIAITLNKDNFYFPNTAEKGPDDQRTHEIIEEPKVTRLAFAYLLELMFETSMKEKIKVILVGDEFLTL